MGCWNGRGWGSRAPGKELHCPFLLSGIHPPSPTYPTFLATPPPTHPSHLHRLLDQGLHRLVAPQGHGAAAALRTATCTVVRAASMALSARCLRDGVQHVHLACKRQRHGHALAARTWGEGRGQSVHNTRSLFRQGGEGGGRAFITPWGEGRGQSVHKTRSLFRQREDMRRGGSSALGYGPAWLC